MSDFSDHTVPLVPEALHGIRSFGIDDTGNLTALFKEHKYMPGTNHAACQIFSGLWPMGKDTHRVPSIECNCGFYAYFDQNRDNSLIDLYTSTRIIGIVRASGRCIVGNLGFRAEKLEIVALVSKHSEEIKVSKLQQAKTSFDDFMINKVKPRIEKFFTPKRSVAVLVAYWTMMMLSAVLNPALSMVFVWGCTALTLMVVAGIASHLYATVVSASRSFLRAFSAYNEPTAEMVTKIHAKYPDVLFFPSIETAKKMFPLTRYEHLPESRNNYNE